MGIAIDSREREPLHRLLITAASSLPERRQLGSAMAVLHTAEVLAEDRNAIRNLAHKLQVDEEVARRWLLHMRDAAEVLRPFARLA
jgi:hypothetical protein